LGNSTLVQFLESVLVFGNDAIKRAGQFLIWKYNSIKVGSDRAFFALAVLIIVIKLDLLQSLDEEKSIVEWVNKVEESERDYEIDCGNYEHYTSSWLFGISLSDLKHDKWEDYLENISLPYNKINLRSAFEGRNIA
jgi:hypothetical protein